MKKLQGFTLIELMVVIAIIGILASIALPPYQQYVHRSEVAEPLMMAATLKERVGQYYLDNLSFPADNKMSGIPDEKLLIGNRISSVKVENGAIHITLGNKASKILHGKVLTFRPAVVTGSPTSPITWLCGYDKPVPGMEAVGDNKTNLENIYLPASCRKKS